MPITLFIYPMHMNETTHSNQNSIALASLLFLTHFTAGLTAVRAAARGQSMLDPSIAGSVLQEVMGDAGGLTARGMAVLQGLANGRSNKQIAADLTIGEETVKTHVGNILSTLQMAQRTQAVVAALKQGPISLDEIVEVN